MAANVVHEETLDLPIRYPYPKVVSKLNQESKERGHMEYPKVKYHAKFNPITVSDKEEEEMLDAAEWKDSPAAFGIITAPSVGQRQEKEMGFDFEALKKKKLAEREDRRLARLRREEEAAEAERKLDAAPGPEDEEDEEEEAVKEVKVDKRIRRK